jgi:hypothetical protein
MGTALLGNQHAKKLTTDELKHEAYRQYCAHISNGKPKKAWCFEHPTLTLTWETMEKYIKEDPVVFDPIKKKVAETKSLSRWFNVLDDISTGKNQKGNVAATQIIVRNLHAWDKPDYRDEDDISEVASNQEKIMAQIRQHQQSQAASSSNS